MADVQTVILDLLTNGQTGSTANRVAPANAVTSGVSLPYVTMHIVDAPRERSQSGDSECGKARVQVDCYAQRIPTVMTLRDDVKADLNDKSGELGDSGDELTVPRIGLITEYGDVSVMQPGETGQQRGPSRHTMDFFVWFRE